MNIKYMALCFCAVFLLNMRSNSRQALFPEEQKVLVENNLQFHESLELCRDLSIEFYSDRGNCVHVLVHKREDVDRVLQVLKKYPPEFAVKKYKTEESNYVTIFIGGPFPQDKAGEELRKRYIITVKADELNDEIWRVVRVISSRGQSRMALV
ncbi:hypothetical protein P4C99_17825 [Pontiellaceae bacterium B1224]|nr:hypothetical protein [Pontiellaceae bacterium B1224]